MKRFLLASCLVAFAACGGGGGGSSPAPAPPPTPPGISNFAYTTASTWPVNFGGGAATGGFKFDFVDSGGDVTTLVIEKLDGAGNVVKSGSTPISGVSGVIAGSVAVAVVADTTVVGTVAWRFHVVDAKGSVSNSLSSTYTITASDVVEPPKVAPSEGFTVQTAEKDSY